MNSTWKKPSNPEWIAYYHQLNQYLQSFKYSLPSFLNEYESSQVRSKIVGLQGLVQNQVRRLQQYNQ